ncbi:MAG: 16S rRNA (cytidine(1402)-2'-O)-methyltransferase [Actinomycetes bacterium]
MLNIYNWNDYYIDDRTIPLFQAQSNLRVNYDVYSSSNEDLLARMRAGPTEYDIIVPTNWFVPTYLKLGLIEPLRTDLMPNLTGRVTLLREVTDLIGCALIYLGHSPNSIKDSDLADVVKLVRSVRPKLKGFTTQGELRAHPNVQARISSYISYGTPVSLAKSLLPAGPRPSCRSSPSPARSSRSGRRPTTRLSSSLPRMKEGRLVVCATPIGNLEDASPRLARALAEADLIACEDTRQTRKLLAHLGVTTRMTSYHDVGERERAQELADRVAAGLRLALVTDAGMPAVSDPGYHLVAACLDRGVPVEVVPGPSAAMAALVVSGLPTDRFCFEGFLPRRPGQRDRRLAELAGEPRTMVLFEAPHRVLATLDAMAAAFGPDRPGAAVRELTKLHEQVLRGPLGELRRRLGEQGPRGELTLVVGGVPAGAAAPRANPADLAAQVAMLVEGGTSTRDAVTAVAEATGTRRKTVYQAVLESRTEPG